MNANSDASIGSAAFATPDAAPAAALTPVMLDRDRRGENRRPVQTKGTLTVLDGPLAGTTHDVLTRDLSLSGISFLLPDALAVGQNGRIDLQSPGGLGSYLCEGVPVR